MKTAHMRTHAGHHHCTAGRRAERRQLEDELTEDTLNLSPMDEVKAEYEAARTGEDGVKVVTGSCSGCGCSIAWVATSKGAGVCLACQEAEAERVAELDAHEWYRQFCEWRASVVRQTGRQPTTTFLEWLEEENLTNPISQTCPECPKCGSHDREDVGDAIWCRECSWAEAKAELRERELAQMPHEGKIHM